MEAKDMRRLIAGMQSSLDSMIGGPDGYADWVAEWSDHYDIMPRVDACLLGGNMYPGYEQYWSAIQNAPTEPLPMTGKLPTPDEVEYGRFAANTPHYVLSSTLTAASWPKTSFVRGLDAVRTLKQQPGKDIYLVGGARTVASLLDAELIDELRLTVHPLLVAQGKPLFATLERRRSVELKDVRQLPGGRVSLVYTID
jgi:dihydrofolate reductase